MKADGTLFTLESDKLLAAVVRHGVEFTRILDKKAGRDVLWGVDPVIWDRHAPVLFPSVGKCYKSRYIYGEEEYQMPTQHGLARDMEPEPVLCDLDECWFKLRDIPETFERYPLHFELEIGHRLEGHIITVMWKVTNLGSGEMLFMMGGHPASQVPERHSIYDYISEFNRKGCRKGQLQEELHYLVPTSGRYELGKLAGTLSLQDGRVELTEGFFDTVLTCVFNDAQVSSASLLLDGRPYVTMGCDDSPYLGTRTIEGTHPFVCLEPWYGICASEGYKGELKDRGGIISLPGWESWSKSYTIQVG